ncbi:hypothetical protein B0H10DRAFT_310683 [Mycena sp. CBHHK59/15]|nr:hypothetical protein B0H10DRAFT_310683 [Mycena sp. CBHHK59/15]
MNRLVRFTGRRPSVFASRRIPLSRPHLRHYVPQKSTPESLYAEYLKDIKTISDKEYRLPPPTPMSFEEFKKSLAESNSPEDWPLKPSSRATLLLEKYGNVMSALDDPEKWTTPDEIQHDLIPKMIDIAHENSKVNDSGNPVFERRLAALEVENTPEVLVARAVSELVLSTTDKWDLERIEHKLARYNGPLSRLNVAVNYFLENPSLIEDFDPGALNQKHFLVRI